MYAPDDLGNAIAVEWRHPIIVPKKTVVPNIFHPAVTPVLKPIIPVLKLPVTPQVTPTLNPILPPPSVTPPITTADAAPATGGPQPIPMPIIRITPGADSIDSPTGGETLMAGMPSWMMIALAGAALYAFTKKGR